jgi:hypothetical protein
VGLAFKSDLDSPKAAARVSNSLNAELEYEEGWEKRQQPFDSLLVVTFFILVVVALVVTIALKITLVIQTLKESARDSSSGQLQEGLMLNAWKRFRLGLASGSDHKDLHDYLDILECDDHVKAGKALWRGKQVAAHLSAVEMAAMVDELDDRLPKSETLGYHFTDLDSCRMILSSQGLRASNVGQLGALLLCTLIVHCVLSLLCTF